MRFYVCDLIGTGTNEDPFRVVAHEYVASIPTVEDGRALPNAAAGVALVACDPTPEEHAAMIADARIRYIPFETAGGVVVGLDEPVSLIPAARRTAIRSALETHGVPMDDLALSDTVRAVVARIVRRFKQRQYLGADDFGNLDTEIGALNSARRSRIAYRLQALGFDLSQIGPTTTIREALKLLRAQTQRTYAWTDEPIPLGNNLTVWD